MKVIVALMLAVFSSSVLAKEPPFQGRLYGSQVTVDPEDLNQELTIQGIKKLKSVVVGGIEATYPVANFLKAGFRFSKRLGYSGESVDNMLTDYSVKIDQDCIAAVMRIPLYQTKFFFLDVFGAYGSTNTKVTINGSTQSGELKNMDISTGWGSTYGGSVGFGYKSFFISLEAGVESNKVGNFERKGLGSNVETLDLSGSYVGFSFVFESFRSSSGKK